MTVTWTQFRTAGAPGISTIWIKGHSSSPYLTDHYLPVAINVGAVARDFATSRSGLVIRSRRPDGTGTMTFSTTNRDRHYFGGTVALSIEGGALRTANRPAGLGAATFSPSFTLRKNDSQTVTITFNGGSRAGRVPVTMRATG